MGPGQERPVAGGSTNATAGRSMGPAPRGPLPIRRWKKCAIDARSRRKSAQPSTASASRAANTSGPGVIARCTPMRSQRPRPATARRSRRINDAVRPAPSGKTPDSPGARPAAAGNTRTTGCRTARTPAPGCRRRPASAVQSRGCRTASGIRNRPQSPGFARQRRHRGDDHRVMRRHHRVTRPGHQHPKTAQVGVGHRRRGPVGHRRRFLVGALAQPDPGPGCGELLAIAQRAAQVCLQNQSQPRKLGPQVSHYRQAWNRSWCGLRRPPSPIHRPARRPRRSYHAFSRAIFSPSRSSDCPSAESFTDTSSVRTPRRGSPQRPNASISSR